MIVQAYKAFNSMNGLPRPSGVLNPLLPIPVTHFWLRLVLALSTVSYSSRKRISCILIPEESLCPDKT